MEFSATHMSKLHIEANIKQHDQLAMLLFIKILIEFKNLLRDAVSIHGNLSSGLSGQVHDIS